MMTHGCDLCDKLSDSSYLLLKLKVQDESVMCQTTNLNHAGSLKMFVVLNDCVN